MSVSICRSACTCVHHLAGFVVSRRFTWLCLVFDRCDYDSAASSTTRSVINVIKMHVVRTRLNWFRVATHTILNYCDPCVLARACYIGLLSRRHQQQVSKYNTHKQLSVVIFCCSPSLSPCLKTYKKNPYWAHKSNHQQFCRLMIHYPWLCEH